MAARDAITAAERVTRDSASNLWFVGRCLPKAKRRLFEAAYAGMRVIDDYVDDDFMRLPKEARAAERPMVHHKVDDWLNACSRAIDGGAATFTGEWAPLYTALAMAAGNSDLAVLAWERLAHAMRWDIDEKPILDWSDFLAYCEGATVAPASIFLYVLQAREEDGVLKADVGAEKLFDQARDMAVFCYLVHIIRDLRKDAAIGGQLVTLPRDMLARHGLDRNDLPDDSARLHPLSEELLEKAAAYRTAATEMQRALIPQVGKREGAVLNVLMAIYGDIHDRLRADPDDPVKTDRTILEGLRTGLLTRFGLAPVSAID